jgi:hypothetical protein
MITAIVIGARITTISFTKSRFLHFLEIYAFSKKFGHSLLEGEPNAVYSTTLTSAAFAWKFTFLCVPSQKGLLLDCPHLHSAVETVPSTMTKLGPFSFDLIVTFTIPYSF